MLLFDSYQLFLPHINDITAFFLALNPQSISSLDESSHDARSSIPTWTVEPANLLSKLKPNSYCRGGVIRLDWLY